MSSTFNTMAKKGRTGTIAISISLVAMAYPFLAIAIAQGHYALTSKDLSERVEAGLLLLTLPIGLCSALSLILSLKQGTNRRKVGIVCSCLGVILNVLFFVVVGATY